MEIIIKEFNGDGVYIIEKQEMIRHCDNNLECPYVEYLPGIKSWEGWFDAKHFDKVGRNISELTDSAEGKVLVVGQERGSTALIRYHFVGSGHIVWKD